MSLLLWLLALWAPMALGQTANSGPSLRPLHVYGHVLYDTGVPVPNAQVQFWQTDVNGSYDHPSPSASNGLALIPDFQYFGTAVTAPSDGSFTFVTYRPGLYGRRPAHIHFKVWIQNTLVLTSQLYFADENSGVSSLLELDLWSQTDGSWATNQTIVLAASPSVAGAGDSVLPLTPSQPEGPFYPAVSFLDFDSDLTQTSSAATAGTTDSDGVSANDSDSNHPPTSGNSASNNGPSSTATMPPLNGSFWLRFFSLGLSMLISL